MNGRFLLVIVLISIMSKSLFSQTEGCTDSMAQNFNPSAIINDGSCIYDTVNVSSLFSAELPEYIDESSGLMFWDNMLWTHNDDTDINIYALDINDGSVTETINLEGLNVFDWEEMDQDEDYIYIGDFGNNGKGNRTDLRIWKISKSSVLNGSPEIQKIGFHYEDQTDLSQQPANQTSFDCEAFILTEDSIYLFTKDWINAISCIYALPKEPGDYAAQKRNCHNVEGLVTGSVYLEDKNLIVLCGYTATLQPFLYLLYDFEGTEFFGGNKRYINLDLPFHQIEAIETQDGLTYYLTNEYFSHAFITVMQALHIVSLEDYIGNWINQNLDLSENNPSSLKTEIFPNPGSEINVDINLINKDKLKFEFFDLSGRKVYEYISVELENGNHSFTFDKNDIGTGTFLVRIMVGIEVFSQKIILE
jgi:hypothetical protein